MFFQWYFQSWLYGHLDLLGILDTPASNTRPTSALSCGSLRVWPQVLHLACLLQVLRVTNSLKCTHLSHWLDYRCQQSSCSFRNVTYGTKPPASLFSEVSGTIFLQLSHRALHESHVISWFWNQGLWTITKVCFSFSNIIFNVVINYSWTLTSPFTERCSGNRK